MQTSEEQLLNLVKPHVILDSNDKTIELALAYAKVVSLIEHIHNVERNATFELSGEFEDVKFKTGEDTIEFQRKMATGRKRGLGTFELVLKKAKNCIFSYATDFIKEYKKDVSVDIKNSDYDDAIVYIYPDERNRDIDTLIKRLGEMHAFLAKTNTRAANKQQKRLEKEQSRVIEMFKAANSTKDPIPEEKKTFKDAKYPMTMAYFSIYKQQLICEYEEEEPPEKPRSMMHSGQTAGIEDENKLNKELKAVLLKTTKAIRDIVIDVADTNTMSQVESIKRGLTDAGLKFPLDIYYNKEVFLRDTLRQLRKRFKDEGNVKLYKERFYIRQSRITKKLYLVYKLLENNIGMQPLNMSKPPYINIIASQEDVKRIDLGDEDEYFASQAALLIEEMKKLATNITEAVLYMHKCEPSILENIAIIRDGWEKTKVKKRPSKDWSLGLEDCISIYCDEWFDFLENNFITPIAKKFYPDTVELNLKYAAIFAVNSAILYGVEGVMAANKEVPEPVSNTYFTVAVAGATAFDWLLRCMALSRGQINPSRAILSEQLDKMNEKLTELEKQERDPKLKVKPSASDIAAKKAEIVAYKAKWVKGIEEGLFANAASRVSTYAITTLGKILFYMQITTQVAFLLDKKELPIRNTLLLSISEATLLTVATVSTQLFARQVEGQESMTNNLKGRALQFLDSMNRMVLRNDRDDPKYANTTPKTDWMGLDVFKIAFITILRRISMSMMFFMVADHLLQDSNFNEVYAKNAEFQTLGASVVSTFLYTYFNGTTYQSPERFEKTILSNPMYLFNGIETYGISFLRSGEQFATDTRAQFVSLGHRAIVYAMVFVANSTNLRHLLALFSDVFDMMTDYESIKFVVPKIAPKANRTVAVIPDIEIEKEVITEDVLNEVDRSFYFLVDPKSGQNQWQNEGTTNRTSAVTKFSLDWLKRMEDTAKSGVVVAKISGSMIDLSNAMLYDLGEAMELYTEILTNKVEKIDGTFLARFFKSTAQVGFMAYGAFNLPALVKTITGLKSLSNLFVPVAGVTVGFGSLLNLFSGTEMAATIVSGFSALVAHYTTELIHLGLASAFLLLVGIISFFIVLCKKFARVWLTVFYFKRPLMDAIYMSEKTFNHLEKHKYQVDDESLKTKSEIQQIREHYNTIRLLSQQQQQAPAQVPAQPVAQPQIGQNLTPQQQLALLRRAQSPLPPSQNNFVPVPDPGAGVGVQQMNTNNTNGLTDDANELFLSKVSELKGVAENLSEFFYELSLLNNISIK